MSRVKDLVGQSYGRLTVTAFVGTDHRHDAHWLCLCACGKETTVNRRNLVKGVTRSCGCLRTEMIVWKNRTHGLSGSKIHSVWTNMIRRCCDKKNKAFKHYGGRGIVVADEWLSFSQFNSDMGSAYKPGLTLERNNVNLGYSKENCRWASWKEQQGNRTNNTWINTPKGPMIQADAARAFGVPRSTFNRWFLDGSLRSRMGWDA